MSDAERLTREHIERMEAVQISVDGSTVNIDCLDNCHAHDMASSVGLLFADKIAAWRRVAAEVSSLEERSERLLGQLRERRHNAEAE
jgi:hypothetical protein